MKMVKILFWILCGGVILFVILLSFLPFSLALLWAGGLTGWIGFVVISLYFKHEIHWLEDKSIVCPNCHHRVDMTFLDDKPAFERSCPYCNFPLSQKYRKTSGGK